MQNYNPRKFILWDDEADTITEETDKKGFIRLRTNKITGLWKGWGTNNAGNRNYYIEYNDEIIGINKALYLEEHKSEFELDKPLTIKTVEGAITVEKAGIIFNPLLYPVIIYHNNKKKTYCLQSSICGRTFSFGTFKREQDARKHRKYLMARKNLAEYVVLDKTERSGLSKKLRDLYSLYSENQYVLFKELDSFFSNFEPADLFKIAKKDVQKRTQKNKEKKEVEHKPAEPNSFGHYEMVKPIKTVYHEKPPVDVEKVANLRTTIKQFNQLLKYMETDFSTEETETLQKGLNILTNKYIEVDLL